MASTTLRWQTSLQILLWCYACLLLSSLAQDVNVQQQQNQHQVPPVQQNQQQFQQQVPPVQQHQQQQPPQQQPPQQQQQQQQQPPQQQQQPPQQQQQQPVDVQQQQQQQILIEQQRLEEQRKQEQQRLQQQEQQRLQQQQQEQQRLQQQEQQRLQQQQQEQQRLQQQQQDQQRLQQEQQRQQQILDDQRLQQQQQQILQQQQQQPPHQQQQPPHQQQQPPHQQQQPPHQQQQPPHQQQQPPPHQQQPPPHQQQMHGKPPPVQPQQFAPGVPPRQPSMQHGVPLNQQQVQYMQVPEQVVEYHRYDPQIHGNAPYLELNPKQMKYLQETGQLPPDVNLTPEQIHYLQQQGLLGGGGGHQQPYPYMPSGHPVDAYGGDDKWKGDFDGMPGISHDLRIGIDARKVQCYYQWYPAGAQVYVTFQVLRGGDRKIGLTFKSPVGANIQQHQWEEFGEFNFPVIENGDYELCFDNTFSQFNSKLVQVYMSGFVEHEFEKYHSELEEMDIQVNNFTSVISTVDGAIKKVINYQTISRNFQLRDWYVIRANNQYVLYWSLAQCLVVLLAGGFQTYFLRSLFSMPSTTSTTHKPRA